MNDDTDKKPPLSVVSDQSPEQLQANQAQRQAAAAKCDAEFALRHFTTNFLRVLAGGGEEHRLMRDMIDAAIAWQTYRKLFEEKKLAWKPEWPFIPGLPEISIRNLFAQENEFPASDDDVSFDRRDEHYAEYNINRVLDDLRTNAFREVASRMNDSPLQEHRSAKAIEKAVESYQKAREERQAVWDRAWRRKQGRLTKAEIESEKGRARREEELRQRLRAMEEQCAKSEQERIARNLAIREERAGRRQERAARKLEAKCTSPSAARSPNPPAPPPRKLVPHQMAALRVIVGECQEQVNQFTFDVLERMKLIEANPTPPGQRRNKRRDGYRLTEAGRRAMSEAEQT